MTLDALGVLPLSRDLWAFATGVVAADNELFFSRLLQELPFTLHRYPSGETFNGWTIPDEWRVIEATIARKGQCVFDGTTHALGVAMYSRSFEGELELDALKPHLVTNPDLPQASMFHCAWQYRPWDADWALCVPYEIYRTLTPGRYRVSLRTVREPGTMIVGEYEHTGESERTIVFNAHTCHPRQANDDIAGVAVLVRLFQWLRGRQTHYTYRLVLGPEHLGTVFYLHDRPEADLRRLVGGAFAEMPGTDGPLKVALSFTGDQPIDRAFAHAARHHARRSEIVPWRRGAGNDETIWEAPGYEVPFVEISRCLTFERPFREYHSSLDTPDLLQDDQLEEFFVVFQRAIDILENDVVLERRFDGLLCLSNPKYGLYLERPDPTIEKALDDDSENWGYLQDCLQRYFDGSMSVLDIAERHSVAFDRLRRYLAAFEAKGLVTPRRVEIHRRPISMSTEMT